VELRSLVAERYGQLDKCYGHCEQPTTLKFLNADGEPVVAAYSCHQAYLSRIILYSHSLDLAGSVATIAGLIGKDQEVKEEDVRIASRYPWDIGLTAGDGQKMMMVAYWTQNYRRTKNEDPNRAALFLCEKCRTIFPHSLTEKQVLCPGCRPNPQPGS